MGTKFKETKSGQIPEEWEVAPLGSLVNITTGTKDVNEGNPHGEYPFFTCAKEHTYSDSSSFDCEALLVAGNANVGRTSYYFGKFEAYQRTYVLSAFNNVIPRYLQHYLQKNLEFYLQSNVHKSAMSYIKLGYLRNFIVYLPPLPEQRKIAEVLSTVDEAIEKTDAIIKETQQLKRGLMQKLFTEGIGHTKFKETKIGRIPEEWEIIPLGDLGDIFKGTSIAASEIVENGLPCIRYGDIYVQYENDNVVTHFSAFIGRDTAERSRRIYAGDILFAGTGETQEDIGKCVAYTITEEAYAGGDLVVFRPQKEHQLNSVFLSYCMNCGEVAKAKSRLGQGLSIFHIYTKNIKTLCVPLPSVPEQNKIAEILSGFDIKIKAEQAYKAELEQLKKGLMQVLLTGQVRVKV